MVSKDKCIKSVQRWCSTIVEVMEENHPILRNVIHCKLVRYFLYETIMFYNISVSKIFPLRKINNQQLVDSIVIGLKWFKGGTTVRSSTPVGLIRFRLSCDYHLSKLDKS